MPSMNDNDRKVLKETNEARAKDGSNICPVCKGEIVMRYNTRTDEHYTAGHKYGCKLA